MITINQIPVTNMTLMLPLSGVWQTGTLVLNTGDASGFTAGTPVSIIDDNGLTFKGVVAPDRVGLYIDTLHLRVIGGKNGMSKTPKPQQFTQAQLRDIIKSITDSSGETLDTSVDQALLNRFIGNWSIFASTCWIALEEILTFVDSSLNWRILPNGNLWFGVDNYSNNITDENAIIMDLEKGAGFNPTEQMYILGLQNLTLQAGINLSNAFQAIGKVARIQYQVESSTIRAQIWNDINGGRGVLPMLDDHIKAFTDRFRFLGKYLGNVVSQSADWTKVDIQSTDATVPDMSGVQLLSGQYYNIVGEKVVYGWFGGDPSKPYAEPFINANNPQFVALANLVNSELKTIASHTHQFTGVGSVGTMNPVYTPNDVSAQKVKAE